MKGEAEVKLRIIPMILLCAVFVSAGYAQTKLPPETRNAALRYWLSFAALKDPPPNVETLELLEKTLKGQAAWDEQRLGGILDMNQESLGIFDRASKLPDCEWGLEYGRDVAASIAYVPRARVLAKLNTLRGIRELAKGNSQGAVDAWLEGIHFSEQLTNGGSLIFGLIAKDTMIPNLQWLTRETQSGRLNEKQKRQVSERLKALPEDGVDWLSIWSVESAGIEQFLVKLQTKPKAEAEYEAMTGNAPLPGCVPPTPEEMKMFQEYLSDVRASFRLGEQEAKKRIEALEPTRKKLCASEQNLIPSAHKTNEARFQLRAAKDALQQALRGN
jgi:hypothetical protein